MVWYELDSLAPPVKTGPEFGVQAIHGEEEILQTKGAQSLCSWHFSRVAGEGTAPTQRAPPRPAIPGTSSPCTAVSAEHPLICHVLRGSHPVSGIYYPACAKTVQRQAVCFQSLFHFHH